MEKLDSEMNRFHSNKIVQSTDGLENGRMNSKRRQTLLRESNIYDILVNFESLSQSEKITHLNFHLLQIGTLTKDTLSPESNSVPDNANKANPSSVVVLVKHVGE